ncbi:MAG TPA: flavodoxin domain-containing protein [Thermoleophilia bacterium]|nr:flavodoxin domain-containing protein [Thermoleophilia bacterium]
MSSVLIAYHSFTGKTKSLAEAAAEGARSAGAAVELSPVGEVSVEAAAAADVLIIATPQTFGTPAGATKELLERLWIAKDELPAGKGFASIVCHASEPAGTSGLFAQLPEYFGFTAVAGPLLVAADEVESGQAKAGELGVAAASWRKSA